LNPVLSGPRPSRPLGARGLALWKSLTSEYEIEDSAGIELLKQCCQAVDLAEALSERIAADGVVFRGKDGLKAHPAMKDSLAARGLAIRTLTRLGLNFEPLRAGPGRPPSALA
jgi:Phage terminase, small subunit